MKTIHVGVNNKYKTINEAIKNINEPTTIILDDETYYEKVVINKDNIIIDGLNKAKVVYDDYAIKIHEDGRIENIDIIPMERIKEDEENRIYNYKANIKLTTGGDYGYTFRVMPKHQMLLDAENLDLVKWMEN